MELPASTLALSASTPVGQCVGGWPWRRVVSLLWAFHPAAPGAAASHAGRRGRRRLPPRRLHPRGGRIRLVSYAASSLSARGSLSPCHVVTEVMPNGRLGGHPPRPERDAAGFPERRVAAVEASQARALPAEICRKLRVPQGKAKECLKKHLDAVQVVLRHVQRTWPPLRRLS
jgi:hypothetical protein